MLSKLKVSEELTGKHLLITGITGFFGKWLLATLAALNQSGAGIEVTALSRSPQRFLAQYPEYARLDWLDWVEGDVQSPILLPSARVIDLILHAATDTLAGAHEDPLRIFDTIVCGARNVLDLAVASGVRKILFTGSGAQYGALHAGIPVLENAAYACDSVLASSAYAEGKRAQETLAALYAQRHGLEIVLARCFAFSGPGIALDAHFAIGNFVKDSMWGDELIIRSDGQAVRSYLHGADLAGWLLTLLTRGVTGNAYNVGSDAGLTIAELAHKVVARIAPGKKVSILGKPVPNGLRSYYVPNIQKARTLGLNVWTSLDHSIDSMASWARRPG
ncbi:NAD-dependent epimerase/dehydratase family protein [Pseudomonas syringae]|uniref:NAD-dependent epimerase/dehydratase family protein n=1 Tax=Pseudomonas syringae TaxID=317 RepID=UPI001E5C4226|nr:NAD(P)-dependent oxidoreductase [Pseudomonas syringae]